MHILRKIGLLAFVASAHAAAATVELGYFSFDSLVPAASGVAGVNGFSVVNLTGSSNLPPEAAASSALTFLNSSITYTLAGSGPVTVQLGNLSPGAAALPLSLKLPSTTTITSATFSATLSASTANLVGNTAPQNLSTTAISVSLTPASAGSVVPILVDAEPPLSLSFLQQPSNALAGLALAPAVTVQSQGNPTASVTVTSNPAGVSATVTAVNGIATFSNLIFNTAGSYTLIASATGTAPAASNGFTISPAAPAKISFLQQGVNGTAGIALASPVSVQLLDAFGNATASGASVTLTSNPAAVSSTVNASNGLATFTNLVFTAARNYTLTASSAGLPNATGSSFSIGAAGPNKLSFLTQPSNGGLGTTIAPAVTLQILDTYGNQTGSTATVSLASNPAAVTASAAAVSGVASFNNLIFTTANSYTLTASSSGLTGATSSSFTVGSGVLTVAPDKPAYSIGQTVTISGTFVTSGGAAVAGASVVINLAANGTTRTLTTVTSAGGAYSTTFQPGPTDVGTFAVTATGAGGGLVNTATTSFRVIGLQLTSSATALTVVMGNSATQSLSILNSGAAALNAVNIALTSNAPASVTGKLTLTGVPTSLAAGASAPFTLAINTSTAPPPGSPVVFTVTATANDATSGTAVSQVLTISTTLQPSTSSSTLLPLNSTLGVNPGASATQQYMVRNDGYVPITNGAVALTNPSATPWLVLGNANLGQVNPGQSVGFQIIANPPATLAAQTISVPFTITGATSALFASLTLVINPSGTTTGSASFNVQDDLGQYVTSSTVTLINKTNPAQTYQGATDANGNVTISGVPAGDYDYVAAATQHDPGSGSVYVTAGGFAQPDAKKGHVGPTMVNASFKALTSPPAVTAIPVLLTYDVVSLSFTVTPTTITDTYVTQLLVLYSQFLVKPVLRVLPTKLDYSFYPQASYPPYPQCFTLQITNMHPTSEVTNVTLDSTQLDLSAPAGYKFQVYFFGPNSKPTDQSTTLNIGNLSGQHLATTPSGSPMAPPVLACGTVNAADLVSRSLGSITVSGQYAYSNPGGIAEIGTTTTPVPVTYTFPTDVVVQPISLIHDETLDINDLRPLDSNYPIYNVTSGRAVTATFLNPTGNSFGGQDLVAFAQTVTNPVLSPVSKSDLSDILSNGPMWRANFFDPTTAAKAPKTGFNGTLGDVASFDISGTGTCGTDLVSCLKGQLSTANRNLILGTPLHVGMGAQWADRPTGSIIGGPDGYKIPVNVYGVISGGITGGGGGYAPVAIPACSSVSIPNYYQPVQCGQLLIDIQITQKFEREAFNISLGATAPVPLSNVTASLVVKNASGQDASSLFTLVVASDPQGITTGGTLASAENIQWQLIPKAGAGGTAGMQYNVSANFNYSLAGQTYSIPTQPVSITVMPLPQLQITYSVPFLAMQNKTEKIRISVQNTGSGVAHNFTATAAQPVLLANPGNTDNANDFNWDFTITGSSPTATGVLQPANTTISFGDIAPGATVSGYYGIVVSNCNYNSGVLHPDCGFIVDSTATMTQQDYNGVMLDPLVGTPVVQFVPAVGGTITDSNNNAEAGLTVTASRAGVTLGSDTTDQEGGYFIGDLTPGPVTLTITNASGMQVLPPDTAITALADSSTNFIDFTIPVQQPASVAVTVGASPVGPSFTVDGMTYTSSQTFNWVPGATHAISTVATQAASAAGTQYAFLSWSNGANISQTIQVPATPVSYVANFATQYLLTTNVSPVGSGNILPGTGYVTAGSAVTISETPNAGYQFASYSGGLTGNPSPATVTVNAPVTVTANFAPIAPLLTAAVTNKTGASNARAWTIALTNSGSGIGLNTDITGLTFTLAAGQTACTTPPTITQPVAGISTGAPLAVGNIGPLGSGSATAVINFSGCSTTARFTVKVSYTANSGAYSSSASFSNQFQ